MRLQLIGAREDLQTQLQHRVAVVLIALPHITLSRTPVPHPCRELISNASDALEKARHRAVTGAALDAPDAPLQIRITTDEAAGTLTFADSGIGMTREELVDHLGTIAKSGSRAFLQKLKSEAGSGGSDIGAGIIGQFGVGFYSAFMVADRVDVFTRAAAPGSSSWCWSSSGDGSFEVRAAEGVSRGAKVVLHLKDTAKEFASPATLRDIITRYSNFVAFPIVLNGKQVNTVGAVWASAKSDVTEEQYTEFYKFKSGDFEPPLYRLHFTADAPLAVKALLYVGASHEEKYGMGRMKPGVDLYSRKVLIEAGCRGILPDWLRFLHGVVDSEDLPLTISRETMQDSALVRRLRSTLTRRVLRFLESEARRDPVAYDTRFFSEFGNFLKEGAVTDATYAADVAKLLRFESSALAPGSLTSFDEYIARCPPGQSSIYYLMAPHRGVAEASPYMEGFRGPPAVEVLFLYSPIDDFVMNNLREFNGRKLVTAETAELDPAALQGVAPAASADASTASAATSSSGASAPVTRLTDAQVAELGEWMVRVLPKRLGKVRATARLAASPAVVTDHESAAVRRMMRLVEQTAGRDSESLRSDAHVLPRQNLEVNPAHPVIVRLHALREAQPELATMAAEQVLDNALVAAGLIEDSRVLLPRLNALLERVLLGAEAPAYAGEAALGSRRFTSPAERDERAAIREGERFYDGLHGTIIEGQVTEAGKDGSVEGSGGAEPSKGAQA